MTWPGFNALPEAVYAAGWSALSLDLPGHGTNLHPGEGDNGLVNWAQRVRDGENVVDTATTQLRNLIAYLISSNYAEAGRIVLSGLSRGGFLAMHAASSIAEVAAAVAFMPVTSLSVLDEFSGSLNSWIVRKTDLGNAFNSTKPVYIECGHRDTRISTGEVARNVSAMLNRLPDTNQIECHIAPGVADGHYVPVGACSRAAAWLNAKVQ